MNALSLQNLIRAWRDQANGHYCQTYNKGMATGLNKAANDLEALLNQNEAKNTYTAAELVEQEEMQERGAKDYD